MFFKKLIFPSLLSISFFNSLIAETEEINSSEDTTITKAAPSAHFQNLIVDNNAVIRGNIIIDGAINSSGSNVILGPSSSTANSVPRFANGAGNILKDSPVSIDDAGNITINGITKNGTTVSWPSSSGAAGTFLASDGAGNLVYSTPAGAGNVSTAVPFSVNNRLITTDVLSGTHNIKQSSVTLDASNNVSGVNTLNATTVNATTINGNASTATNFTGPLSGDVTGTQNSTSVASVGGQSATNVASGTTLALDATNASTPSTIVKRDGSGNFSAGTISANVTGNVTGNLSGTASNATTAASAASAAIASRFQ